MKQQGNEIDWFRLIVRFFFGAVFGVFVGFGGYRYGGASSGEAVLAWVLSCSVLCGILAAAFGDRFWSWFSGR